MHEKGKPPGYFTEEFKELITSLLQCDPRMRPSIADIIGHPWMQGELPS